MNLITFSKEFIIVTKYPFHASGAGLIRFCEQRRGLHACKLANHAPEHISRMGWACARARPMPDGRRAGLVWVR